MRNVFTIFRNDFRSLYKHFFAFLIIIAITILPALYAWFNIYAFWDPYGKTNGIEIAVVSDDKDYMDDDGKIINMGNDLVNELKDDDKIGYVFLDDADEAIDGVYSGKYYAAVIVEENFTYNMYNFLTTDMDSPTISFYQNEKRNPIAVKVVEAAGDNVKQSVNEKYIEAIVETLFDKLNAFSEDVQGDSTVEQLKNTLIKVNNNLQSYNGTIDHFISANNALIDTLKRTNNTISYSIYLIGNERVNISKQIVYIEDSQEDLALINAEVNKLLTGLQDSVQEAIYKLDRLYNGDSDDIEAAKEALAELERQYQELIDYLTHSGLTGTDVEDALTALNKLADKITELRKKIGLDDGTVADANEINVRAAHNEDAINAVKTDFEKVAVPKVYKAVTGNDYKDLTNPKTTSQNLEGMMSFMLEDTTSRIDNIQSCLKTAMKTSDREVREASLTQAKANAAVLDNELNALDVAFEAVEETTGSAAAAKAADAVDTAAEDSGNIRDRIDDILNGNRDIDLINDLQLISDTLGTVRVTLTEIVYPTLNTVLDNIQDSLGDVSSTLLELSNILGKTEPIISELGNTFGAVNNALIQVKDLIASYSGRISDLIDILNGDTDDDMIQTLLDFFNIDPETVGTFLASPVSIKSESVYPVQSYGAAMAPFYTMLAIWVGCVILNAIIKADAPIELVGATDTQRFFGRYLIFFVLGLVQTIIIVLGDIIILGVDCVHPGLFFLCCLITSMTVSMTGYALAVAFGNIGKAIFVVFMIIQIAGSGGSYPIELLPDFFQQVYLFFPFPYAINGMREAIAGLYQNVYLLHLLRLLLFFAAFMLIGLFLRRPLSGLNHYMNEQLEKTEMM